MLSYNCYARKSIAINVAIVNVLAQSDRSIYFPGVAFPKLILGLLVLLSPFLPPSLGSSCLDGS